MTVGHGKPLHADRAVSLWPLSAWQAQSVLWLLAEVACFLCHASAEAGVHLCRTLQLPTQHPHSLTNLVLGAQQALALFILFRLQLYGAQHIAIHAPQTLSSTHLCNLALELGLPLPQGIQDLTVVLEVRVLGLIICQQVFG